MIFYNIVKVRGGEEKFLNVESKTPTRQSSWSECITVVVYLIYPIYKMRELSTLLILCSLALIIIIGITRQCWHSSTSSPLPAIDLTSSQPPTRRPGASLTRWGLNLLSVNYIHWWQWGVVWSVVTTTNNCQVYNNARGQRGESQEIQVNIQPAPRLYN